MELIRYKNVEIRQDTQIVLSDVNLTVQSGELVYLLGRVGSGKSTFMKTLYAEVPVHSGEATFLDYDLTAIRRRQIPFCAAKSASFFRISNC